MSVFATMNSTPRRPDAIMRLTALPPAPPTPMTLIVAAGCTSTSSSNMITSPCRGLSRALVASVGRRVDPRTTPRSNAADPLGRPASPACDGACVDSRRPRSAPRAGPAPRRSRSADRRTFSTRPPRALRARRAAPASRTPAPPARPTPGSSDVPPVSTTPAPSRSAKWFFFTSCSASVKISSMRGSIIDASSVARDLACRPRPPTPGTDQALVPAAPARRARSRARS